MRVQRDGFLSLRSMIPISFWPCVCRVSRKYPGIIVDLTYVSHGEPLQSEVDDPYDFHFHYLDMIPDSEEYEIRETHTTQLCFVSPKTASHGYGEAR